LCPPPDDGSYDEPLNRGERPTDEHPRDDRNVRRQEVPDEPRRHDAASTLSSTSLRDINEKGKNARFATTELGKFAANAP
jgi:hypothetical protein